VKLRCNICSNLARGAVRLPCCEQAICESCKTLNLRAPPFTKLIAPPPTTGHANLPNICPVCDHSPLNPDDCKPNSALRTTVTVYMRTYDKNKKMALQRKQQELEAAAKKQAPPPPPSHVPGPAPAPEVQPATPQPEAVTPAEERVATPQVKPSTPIAGPASLASNEEKKGSPASAKVGSSLARFSNSS
jgi:hypothetical protein